MPVVSVPATRSQGLIWSLLIVGSVKIGNEIVTFHDVTGLHWVVRNTTYTLSVAITHSHTRVAK